MNISLVGLSWENKFFDPVTYAVSKKLVFAKQYAFFKKIFKSIMWLNYLF